MSVFWHGPHLNIHLKDEMIIRNSNDLLVWHLGICICLLVMCWMRRSMSGSCVSGRNLQYAAVMKTCSNTYSCRTKPAALQTISRGLTSSQLRPPFVSSPSSTLLLPVVGFPSYVLWLRFTLSVPHSERFHFRAESSSCWCWISKAGISVKQIYLDTLMHLNAA